MPYACPPLPKREGKSKRGMGGEGN